MAAGAGARVAILVALVGADSVLARPTASMQIRPTRASSTTATTVKPTSRAARPGWSLIPAAPAATGHEDSRSITADRPLSSSSVE